MNEKRLFQKVLRLFGRMDSFYLLDLYCQNLIRNKRKVTPRLLETLSRPLSEKALLATEETLTAALAYENSLQPFTEEEILAFDEGVTLALLMKLKDADGHTEEGVRLFENAVMTLRYLESADREERYLRLSTLELFLRHKDPLYAKCDRATRDDIKGRVVALAKKEKLDEITAATLFLSGYDPARKRKKQGLVFLITVYALSFVLTLSLAFFGVPILLLPFLFFPVCHLIKELLEGLLRRFVTSHPIPALKLETIPDEGKTLVVITTLLTSCDKTPFERLERFFLGNKDENLRFGLLLDLADAPEETTPEDETLLAFAEEELSRLTERQGDHFFLALRQRTPSSSEGVYMGRERKRGAIIDFLRFAKGEDDAFLLFLGDRAFLKDAVYLITLDADTDLAMGSVRKMVGAMLHPHNKAVIEKGAVRKGYGILQPRMAVTTGSAARSRFSLLLCGSGGLDPYAGADFDTYQTLFDEGIFCGKGILDIAAFNTLIPNAFEEESILSHDLIEGNLLRAGYLSNLVLTDSFPKTPLSYYTRAHRWYRGDLQAMPYAFESPKNARGKRSKNPVGPLGRYKLFDNLRRLITPAATLLALLLSLLFSKKAQTAVAITVALTALLPFFISLVTPKKRSLRRYFSRILQGTVHRFLLTLYTLFSVAHLGMLALDALGRSLFRMFVSKKKLLKWTAQDRADRKKSTAASYLYAAIPDFFCGILLLTFAESPPLRLFALAFLFFPLVLVLLSYEFPPSPKPLSSHEKARLSRYVFDHWSFFAKFVTAEDNHLPPDNFQETPVKALARRTSPTNIGMYLTSCLAARDFGFIETKELLERTANTLTTLEKMPKKQGHLYNWYDTETLALLGEPFVSSVDSGNLAVSLLTLKEGLLEYAEEEPALRRVAFRYEKLLNAMDFTALYCKKRNLFYIAVGSNEPSPLSCYDLYMSEARSAGYYAIATGAVPRKHWAKLSRTVVAGGSYTGLASWSGTTFEYFMPHLFLPLPKSSLADEALAFAVSCQKKKKTHGFFGISESAYYAFDADMNYQYRAHGVDTLALDENTANHRVYSPYSAFLMLKKAPHAALASLDAFRDYGAYGECGFYEAVDLCGKGRDSLVIKSYMSHHVGMSILAAANAVFDDIFVRRFLRDPRMAAAEELLEEKIPTDTPVFSGKIKRESKAPTTHFFSGNGEKKLRTEKNSDRLPTVALISNRLDRLTVSSEGVVTLSQKDIAITYPAFSGFARNGLLSSLRLVFAYDGKCYAALPDLFSYSATKAVFKKEIDKVSIKTTFTLHGEKSLYGISFSASGLQKKITPTLLFEPILAKEEAFRAHPFYRALSIEAFYEKETGILYFFCRQREEEKEKWLAILADGEGDLLFDTRKDVLPFGYGEKDLVALAEKELPCRVGATVSPFAVLRKAVSPRMGKANLDFILAFGESRKEVKEAVLSVKKKNSPLAEILAETLRPVFRRLYHSLGEDRPNTRYRELYLSALLYPEKSEVRLSAPTHRSILWQASISGDLPIIAIAPSEKESDGSTRLISILLKMHRLLRACGMQSDLVFLCRETDSYHKPLSKRMGQLIAKEGESGYLGKKGGIFLLSAPACFEAVAALSCLYLPLDENASPEEVYYRVTGRKRQKHQEIITLPEENTPPTAPQGALRVTGGYFEKNSFTVIKSEVDTPRSFVYASSVFGTLLSASSPGYTWLGNAKEKRITEPSDNLLSDFTEERILATLDGRIYDLLAMAHTVEFGEGAAVYRGTIARKSYTVKVGVDRKLPVKLVLAELPSGARLLYSAKPSFGVAPHFRHALEEHKEGESRFFFHHFSPHLSSQVAFLSPLEGDKKQGYLFGVFPQGKEALYHLIRKKYRDAESIEGGFYEYASHYRELFSPLHFSFPDPALDVLMNRFIPYQSYVIRMLGRAGYHQSGGAFGFRDQLQDSLSMLYYDAAITRRQIFRSAAHQYAEGDVQHWWHNIPSENGMGAGVRTRISDDMLWLPYAVSEYLFVTGDEEILATSIAYLDSPPLAENENDRYESPQKTRHKESLYRHCMRAMEASYRLSERGIPLIGGGDWNDAFNRVGILGKGESVFLARFMQIVFRRFSKVCRKVGDTDSAKLLESRADGIADACEIFAWEDDRYLRGSYDNGTPLGSEKNRECKLDSLSQSFSALAEGATDRTETAMNLAFARLYDREHKLFKLFDPPFPAHKREAGYIAAYSEGIRENGGQYNHGILFAARAFYAIGEKEKGFALLSAVNPCRRSLDATTAKSYRSEPYALCGDVYTNPQHMGKGGWSLYTGAAGWFLRTVLESLMGYCEYPDHFTLSPALTEKMPSFSLKLSRKNTVYHINVTLADKPLCLVDGKKQENKFLFDGGTHILQMDIEKEEKL